MPNLDAPPRDLPLAPGAPTLTRFAIDYPTFTLALGLVFVAFGATEMLAGAPILALPLTALIPAGIGLAVLGFWWRGHRIVERLRAGLPTTGEVTGILRRQPRRGPASFIVAYRYRAAGREHTGYRNFTHYADAARWKSGDRANLRVDQADPTLSQLQDS